MIKYTEKTLDELGVVARGKSKHRPRDAAFLYGGQYPFIQTADVKNANLYINSYNQTYSEEGLKQSKLWSKGTLCITIAANIADTAILDIEACFPDSVIGFIANEDICNVKYIKYYLSYYQNALKQISQGAAQDNLNLKKLLSFKFRVPSKKTQDKIVNILSSYDDLIENNLKRIKLLEESAELIYKEWFVNFRFPGYEKYSFVDNIPQYWEKINLYDIADIKMGYAFKADDFNEEGRGVPAIRIRDIPNQTTKTYTTEEVDSDYIINKGDILIGMDGNFYNDVWAGEEGYLVQRVCRLRAKREEYQGFLWQAIKQPINYYEKTITGATVAHLGAKHLKEIEILTPGKECKINIGIFNNLYKQKVKLLQENIKLKDARDILIPKLITGEIEV